MAFTRVLCSCSDCGKAISLLKSFYDTIVSRYGTPVCFDCLRVRVMAEPDAHKPIPVL